MDPVRRSLLLIRNWQRVSKGAFQPAGVGSRLFGAAGLCWRKTRGLLAVGVRVFVAGFLAGQGDAATYTWDANGAAAGVTDGAGIWNTTAGNVVWWDGATNTIWSNSGPNDAVFGNSNGPAGTVTIGSAITVAI